LANSEDTSEICIIEWFNSTANYQFNNCSAHLLVLQVINYLARYWTQLAVVVFTLFYINS